jgi:hypothetical protein
MDMQPIGSSLTFAVALTANVAATWRGQGHYRGGTARLKDRGPAPN